MFTIRRRPRCFSAVVLAASFAWTLASARPAAAQDEISQIVVFGDSLSDPGNSIVFVDGQATPPDYSMGPLLIPTLPYARGGHHLTNGATWIEQFARPLGLARSVRPAFRSANPHAMNFAVATARARDNGQPGHLSDQLAAFFLKTGGVAPSDALYVIQVGGNDVRDALLAAAGGGNPLPILQEAVASIAATINVLYAAGARYFLVWNAPDVGLTPAVRLLEAQVPGASQLASGLSLTFNLLLAAAVNQLQLLPGIDIVLFDAADLITNIVANPAVYGLTNVTDACVSPGVPPFACSHPDDYLFWDGVHPTRAVHSIIAREIAALLGL